MKDVTEGYIWDMEIAIQRLERCPRHEISDLDIERAMMKLDRILKKGTDNAKAA